MTLCIAAYTHDGIGEPRIVMCCDWLTGDETSTAEKTYKCILTFAPGFCAMFAGRMEDVGDIARLYDRRIKLDASGKQLSYEAMKEELWMGMREFRDWLERCGRKKGITDVQLLVCGFIEREPLIISVDQSGVTRVTDSHWSIGSGSPNAEIMLRYRTQGFAWFTDLRQMLYYVYEAKRMGEMSPYVGELTSLMVLKPRPDGGFVMDNVNPNGINFLKEEFERFGPQKFTGYKPFPMDSLFTAAGQPGPLNPTDDQLPQPPLPELPRESDES